MADKIFSKPVKLLLAVDYAWRKKLKIVAAVRDTTMGNIIREAVDQWMISQEVGEIILRRKDKE